MKLLEGRLAKAKIEPWKRIVVVVSICIWVAVAAWFVTGKSPAWYFFYAPLCGSPLIALSDVNAKWVGRAYAFLVLACMILSVGLFTMQEPPVPWTLGIFAGLALAGISFLHARSLARKPGGDERRARAIITEQQKLVRRLTQEKNSIWRPQSGEIPETVTKRIMQNMEQLEEAEKTLTLLQDEFTQLFGTPDTRYQPDQQ